MYETINKIKQTGGRIWDEYESDLVRDSSSDESSSEKEEEEDDNGEEGEEEPGGNKKKNALTDICPELGLSPSKLEEPALFRPINASIVADGGGREKKGLPQKS